MKASLWSMENGWEVFDYETQRPEFEKRGIRIHETARIGYGASIGNRASIGDGATIGDGARIGKTIFITGSRNPVNYYGLDIIHIGCIRKTIAEWQEQYPEVGRENDYSDEQIREYGAYIQMIAELHKTWNIEVPAYEA
jgi:NDP-sugar pyrophosphorylase family protein